MAVPLAAAEKACAASCPRGRVAKNNRARRADALRPAPIPTKAGASVAGTPRRSPRLGVGHPGSAWRRSRRGLASPRAILALWGAAGAAPGSAQARPALPGSRAPTWQLCSSSKPSSSPSWQFCETPKPRGSVRPPPLALLALWRSGPPCSTLAAPPPSGSRARGPAAVGLPRLLPRSPPPREELRGAGAGAGAGAGETRKERKGGERPGESWVNRSGPGWTRVGLRLEAVQVLEEYLGELLACCGIRRGHDGAIQA